MYKFGQEQTENGMTSWYKSTEQDLINSKKSKGMNYAVLGNRITQDSLSPKCIITRKVTGCVLPNKSSTSSIQFVNLGSAATSDDKRKKKKTGKYKGVIDLIKGIASASFGGYVPDGGVRLHNKPYLPNVSIPAPVASMMNYFSMQDIDKWEEDNKKRNKAHRERVEAMKRISFAKPVAEAYEKFMDFNEAREGVFPFRSPAHAVAAIDIGLGIDEESNNLSSVSDRFAQKIDKKNSSRQTGTKEQNTINFRNALRHAIWQGVLASQYNPQVAYSAAIRHETRPYADIDKRTFSSEAEADQVTDLLNNVIGRKIGAENTGLSRKQIALLVLEELWKNGLFHYEHCNDGTWRIAKVRISDEVFSSMYQDFLNSDDNGRW